METPKAKVNIEIVAPAKNGVMQSISVPGWDHEARPLVAIATVERMSHNDNLVIDLTRDGEKTMRIAFALDAFTTFVDYLNEVRIKLKEDAK